MYICAFTLSRGTPADWNNLYTSFKMFQNNTIIIIIGKRTIECSDLQLFSKFHKIGNKR